MGMGMGMKGREDCERKRREGGVRGAGKTEEEG